MGFNTSLLHSDKPSAETYGATLPPVYQVSAFACLAIGGIIPVWVILILAAKELVQMTGGWLLLRRYHDVPPSNKYGKAASAVFYFVTIAVIVFDMPRILQICLLGGALHFLPMFVRSRQEECLLAEQAVVLGEHVGQNGRVGVADVGDVVHIVNGCGDVEVVFVHDGSYI